MDPRTQLGLSATVIVAVAMSLLTSGLGATPTIAVDTVDAAASATALRDATEPPAAPRAAGQPRPATDAAPRVQLPERGEQIAVAPDPEPEPAPDPAPEPEPEPTEADEEPDARPTRSSDGERIVAGGTSTDPVDSGGRTVRWTLEVETATGLDVEAVLAVAEAALYDERSWAQDRNLVRIDDPGRAHVRVLVATPATVDRLCAQAGLNTAGWLSCWNGSTAAINVDRWNNGTREITDLALYRRYVVNHEFGHALGHGHRDCRGSGELAHVMQQQTKTLAGCVANEWPYPDA